MFDLQMKNDSERDYGRGPFTLADLSVGHVIEVGSGYICVVVEAVGTVKEEYKFNSKCLLCISSVCGLEMGRGVFRTAETLGVKRILGKLTGYTVE